MSQNNAVTSRYFSGQGILMIAKKDAATGKPLGFRNVGNCSALTLGLETSTLEHKESSTGQRGTDLRLTTEVGVNMAATLESLNKENLAIATRGLSASVVAGVQIGEAGKVYLGTSHGLKNISINEDTNIVQVMPVVGTLVGADIASFENGASTITFAAGVDVSGVAAGDIVVVTGSSDNDGTFITSGAATGQAVPVTVAPVDEATSSGVASIGDIGSKYTKGSDFTVNAEGGSINIVSTGAMDSGGNGENVVVLYDYDAQETVEGMTEGAQDYVLRFEGLNTAESNAPVVVEVHKFSADPLQELALINDNVAEMVLEGSCLADATQAGGTSQYFKVYQSAAA